MTPTSPKRAILGTVLMVLAHLAGWSALFGYVLTVPPRYEQRFREFNMQLPAASQMVFAVARWAGNYWYVLLVCLPFLLAADAALVHVLRSRKQPKLGAY
jgi:type II secretory pathway component PulF